MDFRRIKFKDLKNADLYLDAVYEGGNTKNAASEPLVGLLSVSVSGGFRYAKNKRLCCLFTTQDIPEWPDEFDIENGLFYYWGDNRKPGQERDRPVGNKSLKEWFHLASKGKEERKKISPIFVFSREKGWNRRFQGLLVPGCNKMSEDQNLISVWKQKNGLRFENYKAIFSILDVKKIPREWIQDILDGNPFSQNTPKAWMDWINNGTIKNLKVSGDIAKIKKEDQLPISKEDKKIHELIIKFFRGKDDYSEFEYFAAKIFELSEITAQHGAVTRYTKDYGRDAYGTLTIGKGWGKCDFD